MSQSDQVLTIGAGETLPIGSTGSIFVYKAEAGNTPIDVYIDGATRRMETGDVTGVPPEARLRIGNTDDANPITVRVFHGDDIYQAAKIAGSVDISGPLGPNGGVLTEDIGVKTIEVKDNAKDPVVVSALSNLVIATENDNRDHILVQALVENTAPLDVTNTSTHIICRLEPGQSIELTATQRLLIENKSNSPQEYIAAEFLRI